MKAVKRITVTDTVINEIKKYLFSGKIKSGEKLFTETVLAEQLNVGRSTVREAIRTLDAMGYVELKPGKGAFAVVTNKDEEKILNNNVSKWFIGNEIALEEFQEVRKCIEPYAVRLTAERHNEKGIQNLKIILNNFEKACECNDLKVLSQYDREFHLLLIKESGNNLLYKIYEQIIDFFFQYSTRSYSILENTAQLTLNEHKNVFSAICNRDADKAEMEMINHLNIASQRMNEIIHKNK